jgi:3-isopropylmalate/(R)-2-methylmalate dehydratase large subunit
VQLELGRALYLCAEPELVRRQLQGEVIPLNECARLANDVSTDEMTPAYACYFYDERLADYCLVGFRGGVVDKGAVRTGNFRVLVGGANFGCGSSRETAPFAQRAAGVRLVVARSFERIYRDNCHNLGIFTSTDFGVLTRLEQGQRLDSEELLAELDPLARAVVEAGGLGGYARDRRAGRRAAPRSQTGLRPMTLVEKILSRHAVAGETRGLTGVPAVAPGDALLIRADVRFSHDYVTAMLEAQLEHIFGASLALEDPASIFLFRDHLSLLGKVMPEAQRRLGLFDRAEELARVQQAFADRHGLRLFGDAPTGGSEGICHNLVIEHLALPGDVVVGTDSHTCMAGVLGCVAFGVGSSEMAAGFVTREFRVQVPASVRIELTGRLRAGVTAKDAWLALLARSAVRAGLFRGRAIELGGAGYFSLSIDERATLTNMSAEAGAFTGIGEADAKVVQFLVEERGLEPEQLHLRCLTADRDATYADVIELCLSDVEPMLAVPGDPKNGVALSSLSAAELAAIRIDIAYGGSCTGGKRADMDHYAQVLGAALARGLRVPDTVSLFIQFGSQTIRRYAAERGYMEIFAAVGAQLVEPSCGACIAAGPGVSSRRDQVTVSSVNRNFPGRSGPGQVYLASPLVVAASAIAGHLASPAAFLEGGAA